MFYECDYQKYLESVIGHFIGNGITNWHSWYNLDNVLFIRCELTTSRLNFYSYNKLALAVAKVGIELVSFDFFATIPQLELTFKVG